ncbi:unnamed protein product [Sympodiomycopsis kandeliae]
MTRGWQKWNNEFILPNNNHHKPSHTDMNTVTMNRGFLNPQNEKRYQAEQPRGNFLTNFWNNQIVHPEKVPGNIGIAWATSFAGIAIILIRTFGKDVLVPQH